MPSSGTSRSANRLLACLAIDLRTAVRGVTSGRGTTLLAFSLLTLAMASGTVIFSVVDAVALRALPYGAPNRLVSVTAPSPVVGRYYPPSPQDYFAWLHASQSFESLGAARILPSLLLRRGTEVVSLNAQAITANLFQVLDVRPALGRFFGPEDERLAGNPVVILSHEVWMTRFGADPGIIGRQVNFGSETRTVVGVLPGGVSYPIGQAQPPDVYVPYIPAALDRSPEAPRRGFISVVGRLRPGKTVEQAGADANRLAAAVVVPLHDYVVGPAKRWLLLVLAAVGVVLLVACANVATLLLARGAARASEFATREALGASRGRLAAGLVVEGVLLALASASAALLLSFWGVATAKANLPPDLTRIPTIAINWRVFSAAMTISAVCGLLFSSVPAWVASRSDLAAAMKTGGGQLTGGRRREQALNAFLVADVAFVCVLLVATTLIIASFLRVLTADLGFDGENVMEIGFVRVLQGRDKEDLSATVDTFRAQLLERAKSVLGVSYAAITVSGTPLSGASTRGGVTIPDYGRTKSDDRPLAYRVTPEYFRVMGIQLVRGRTFWDSDREGAPPVMLINDTMALRFFPGRDPVGEVVTVDEPTTIVGVLRGVHVEGPERGVEPEMYLPLAQRRSVAFNVPELGGWVTTGTLVVRTTTDPRHLAAAIHAAIAPALRGGTVDTRFVRDRFRRLTAVRRINAQIMAIFGAVALVIATIGTYGATAFFVNQQIPAIGVRMALGASPGRILRSVLKGTGHRIVLGVSIGSVIAWGASGAIESFVFGVQTTDSWVYATVGGFLVIVGLAAAFVPALTAAHVDPNAALRHE